MTEKVQTVTDLPKASRFNKIKTSKYTKPILLGAGAVGAFFYVKSKVNATVDGEVTVTAKTDTES